MEDRREIHACNGDCSVQYVIHAHLSHQRLLTSCSHSILRWYRSPLGSTRKPRKQRNLHCRIPLCRPLPLWVHRRQLCLARKAIQVVEMRQALNDSTTENYTGLRLV